MPQPDLLLRPLDDLAPLPGPLIRLLDAASAETAPADQDLLELTGAEGLAPILAAQARLRRPDLTEPAGARIVDALGADDLCRAALAISAVRVFGAGTAAEGALDHREFWRHGLAVGLAAELAAGRTDPAPPALLAFACGLLHDVGKAALDAAVPKSYRRVLAAVRSETGDIARAEREILGLDHALAGRRVAQRWRLPRRIEEAVWLHHHPLQGHRLGDAGLIALVRMADIIARHRRIGFSGNYTDCAGDAELMALAGLTPVDVAAIADALPAAFENALWMIERTPGPAGRPTPAVAPQATQADHAPPPPTPGDLPAVLGGFVADLATATGPAPLCARMADLYASCFLPPPETAAVWAFHIDEEDGKAQLCPQASGSDRAPGRVGWRPAPPPTGPLAAGGVLKDRLDPADAWCSTLDLDQYTLLPLATGTRWLGGLLTPDGARAEGVPAFGDLMAFLLAAAIDRDRADRLAEGLALSSQHLAETREALAAAQAFAAVGEMAAGAAHEMNNPLTVISGRAQLLALKADSDQQRAAAEEIVEKAEELSRMTVDLLAFARPAPPSPQAVPVAELLEPVKDQALSKAKQKQGGLRVDIRLWPDCPAVWADAAQIRGVLAELIDNAVQAAQGQVSVCLEASAENKFQQVMIRVTDDGPGMAEDVVASAFTPFFSHRPAGRGKGMGLALARRCVQSNGGRIWIDSRPGGGTTVHLQLPRALGDVPK